MTSSRPSDYALTRPGRLRMYSTAELLRMPPPAWQVEGIIPAGGLVGLYGPPGTGKSFIAIDAAMHIASGRPYHGHKVEPGYGLYVSAEGGTGIGKRAQAWLQEYNISPKSVDMAWLTESIPVTSNSEDMDVLFERIYEDIKKKPSIVVIDTLARCFDGDENLQEDMGRFIAGVDRLRREFSATVVVVHHTRLGADRERGSTAFRGAADTMLSVSRKDKTAPVELDCDKQKDAEEFSTLQFEMKVVPVVLRGLEDTSCVMIDARASRDAAIIGALTKKPRDFGTLKELLVGSDQMSLSTLKRGLVSLLGKHEITKKNGEYSLKPKSLGSRK